MKYVMIGGSTKKMNLCSAHGATLAGVEHHLLIALNGGHKKLSSQSIGNLSIKWTRSRSIKNGSLMKLFMEQPNLSSTNLPPQRTIQHF